MNWLVKQLTNKPSEAIDERLRKKCSNYSKKLQDNLGIELSKNCKNDLIGTYIFYEMQLDKNGNIINDFMKYPKRYSKAIKDIIHDIQNLRKKINAYNTSKIVYKNNIVSELYRQEFWKLIELKNILFKENKNDK